MVFQFQPDDIDMLQSFVEEATEYLQIVETEAMRLEGSHDKAQSVGTIFRQLHTIKGLAAFFGLSPITELSHEAEFMLDAMRKGSITPEEHSIGLLLTAKDELFNMIHILGSACQSADSHSVLEIELALSEPCAELISAIKKTVDTNQDRLIEKAAEGMLEDFLLEADEHAAAITNQFLLVLDTKPEDAQTLAEVFRRVHTIKGNIGLLLSVKISSDFRNLLESLIRVFQELETLLAQTREAGVGVSSTVTNLCFAAMDALLKTTTMIRAGHIQAKTEFLSSLTADIKAAGTPAADTIDSNIHSAPKNTNYSCNQTVPIGFATANNTIRVNGEKLDRLMNIIGELSITKNVFTRMARKLMLEHNLPQMAREVKETGQFINRISEELEDAIMSLRMTEVRTVFQKFPRIVRDIALQTDKSITLYMEGEDTQFDKNIVEQIGDPLLHLVRNAADHGIETAAARAAAGKEPEGSIWLRAYNQGKSVCIEVEDNGSGMDPEVLKAKAVEKGFISQSEAEMLTDEQCYQLIFLPGFSTARQISEISGRGVGMDVVKSNITALQGSIRIASQLGKGSKITITLPLTLMVSKGLLVIASGQSLIIPIENVIETLKAPAGRFITRKGRGMLHHRQEVLGVVSLAGILGMTAKEQEVVPTVVITNGSEKVGVTVDRLLSEQDVIVKPLPDYLSNLPAMGGAAILGDGTVAIVLNAAELIAMAHQ